MFHIKIILLKCQVEIIKILNNQSYSKFAVLIFISSIKKVFIKLSKLKSNFQKRVCFLLVSMLVSNTFYFKTYGLFSVIFVHFSAKCFTSFY